MHVKVVSPSLDGVWPAGGGAAVGAGAAVAILAQCRQVDRDFAAWSPRLPVVAIPSGQAHRGECHVADTRTRALL